MGEGSHADFSVAPEIEAGILDALSWSGQEQTQSLTLFRTANSFLSNPGCPFVSFVSFFILPELAIIILQVVCTG